MVAHSMSAVIGTIDRSNRANPGRRRSCPRRIVDWGSNGIPCSSDQSKGRSSSQIPVEITAIEVVPGERGREMVSLDISDW